MRKMNSVVVDEEKKLLTVGGGCTWADVDEEAAKYGLATVGGMFPSPLFLSLRFPPQSQRSS